MWLTIHRGSKQIGGSCVELQSGVSRILIDLGLPLVDENGERVDPDAIRKTSKEDLIKQGLLPDIPGLYKHEKPAFDGILLSHSHQDHYGLLSFVNPQVPIYLSEGCKELVHIAHFFGQTDFVPVNARTVKPWKTLAVGDFRVTPYLVDHSAFDALAFLIEAEGKRLFYSGDFRGHGRKSILFQNMLKRPPQNITSLILEGSMFGRTPGPYQNEVEVQHRLVELFEDKEQLYFLACSSQNVDRLVSVYKACLKTGRTFVIDPYTAYILDKLKRLSPNIPQFDWGQNIRVFFVPNTYTHRMAENKSLFKFKSAKITCDEMEHLRSRLLIKDTYKTSRVLIPRLGGESTTLIYSLWSGYLPEVKSFWEQNNVPIVEVHCGGHAYVEDLQEFVRSVGPMYIVPVHTFFPEKYSEYFEANIRIVADKEPVEV